MAQSKIIQFKRGLIANVAGAVLKSGELAIGWNEDKTKIQLWVGTGTEDGKGKIPVNPDVTIPSNVSEFNNDADYQTGTQVSQAISTAIANAGHASFEESETVPTAETAKSNVLYLVKNTDTGYYDIYALVSGEVVRLDDTTIDISTKLDKPETDGTAGQVLKRGADGKPEWADDSDTTYTSATQEDAGLMSAADKVKLDGIKANEGNTQTVSQAEKDAWNGDIDCGEISAE